MAMRSDDWKGNAQNAGVAYLAAKRVIADKATHAKRSLPSAREWRLPGGVPSCSGNRLDTSGGGALTHQEEVH
jgi:hypothetical protein